MAVGIHNRNVLRHITNGIKADATSESSVQGHGEVNGQIGVLNKWTFWCSSSAEVHGRKINLRDLFHVFEQS